MNYLLILLFALPLFFSIDASAGEYLVYSNKKEIQKLSSFLIRNPRIQSVKNVFTPKEITFLQHTNVNPFVLKINIQSEDRLQIQTILKSKFDLKIGPVTKYKLQSDQYFNLQWGLQNNGELLERWLTDIDLLKVQGIKGEDTNSESVTESDKVITVAVIDSGIDVNHPDLKENILFKAKECEDFALYQKCLLSKEEETCHNQYATIDNDNNGYPLDCNGWNVAGKVDSRTGLQGNNIVKDIIGHGTHVAGIIGATHNKFGIRGIAKNVKILPVQVNGSNQQVDLAPNETPTDIIAKGILYAIKSKVQVINLSLGWSLNEDSLLMRQMIKLAHKNKILVVAAGGNSHHAGPTYPCSYEDVICVGSHTVNGKLSNFSNFGTSIDIVAPGTQILSTWPTAKRPRSFTEDNGFEYMSGTSQAAPFVSGALAKLLNSGLSPEHARVKLLKGSRGISQKFIRHGNLDVKKAIHSELTSFLYPLNKTPLLIQWQLGKSRKFRLKIKNYGTSVNNVKLMISPIQSVTQDSIELQNKFFTIDQWSAFETKEFNIQFNSVDDIESDIYFEIHIQSEHENKTYKIHTQALTLVSSDYKADNVHAMPVEKNNFLTGATLRPIEGFDTKQSEDFIAIKETNGKTQIALLKANQNGYKFLGPLTLPLKSPIFLKFSRVNIDLQGQSEYVLTLVDMGQSRERATKFFVLDSNFKPMRYNVLPKNSYDNKLSVLPGSYIWLKYENKMLPAWIGVGKRPEYQRTQATPWRDAPPEFPKYHLYLLRPEGVTTLKLPSDEDQFISFLYQSKAEKSRGIVQLVTSRGLGYYKDYYHYKFQGKLKLISKISLKRYHNLLGLRSLPVNTNPNESSAFFFTSSVDGAQNISMFQAQNNQLEVDQEKIPSFSKYDPIIHVLKANADGVIYQTRYHLGFYDRNTFMTSKIESKVNAKRIRHQLLKFKSALFLSSVYTPGIASEIVAAKETPKGKTIYRSARWRMLGVKSCNEIGMIEENGQDKLTYFCEDLSEIIKISY